MLLTDNFIQKIQDYDNLKGFDVSTEKITNVYFRIILKLLSIEIWIDVEEQEAYASFIIHQKSKGKEIIYYALSDYALFDHSSSNNHEERLQIFASEKEEEEFVNRLIQAKKSYRKLFSRDKNGDGIVICILALLDKFVNSLL
jgi:hypothetical protein